MFKLLLYFIKFLKKYFYIKNKTNKKKIRKKKGKKKKKENWISHIVIFVNRISLQKYKNSHG